MLKTAIIHEWFIENAGSERCVESFIHLFPDADVFSLVDFFSEADRKIILNGKKAHTSFIQKLPFARKKFRNYLSLFPLAVEQFDVSPYDVVISNSHAAAKGVITRFNQLHITYCHSPMRYAWDLYHQYLAETGLNKGLKGFIAQRMLHRLRIWDVQSAMRPDFFLANSIYTARRIKKTYNREADVIYPPVDVDRFPYHSVKEDFYLTASRLVPYKKIDIIAEAFTAMPDKKLLIIGDGPEMKKIKSKAGRNVEVAGYLRFPELLSAMQKARAFVFAAIEDFGIVNVEAMACGTPVLALDQAGTAETVQDGITGIHFHEQTAEAVRSAVLRFEQSLDTFDTAAIHTEALKYSRASFEDQIRIFIDEKCKTFF